MKDFIAIFDRDADRSKVPAGFIAYSDKELRVLFADDVPEGALRQVHEAKRSGADVTGAWKEASDSLEAILDNLRKGHEWLRKQHNALYDNPGSVDLDQYTRGLDKWDGLEATLRQIHGYHGCVLGEGRRCPPDSQPTCSSCAMGDYLD